MAFTGQLNKNEIYNAIFNMIISQEIYPDRIREGDDLVDKAKTDGSLFGDTKLYYSVDALRTKKWGGDSEATNLLKVNRAPSPEVQAITLDIFRYVPLTLDDYLSKRAWSDEGTFGTFNALMGGMLAKTKYLYSTTNYAAFFGTHSVDGQVFEVDVDANGTTAEDEVKTIANALANLVGKVCLPSRKFNDYGQRTKFAKSDLTIVWNTAWLNRFRNIDLPTIFHTEFADFANIKQTALDAVYWGTIVSDVSVPAESEGVYRSLYEQVVGGDTNGDGGVDYLAGDIIPAGSSVEANSIYKSDCNDEELAIDSDSIAKIIVRYPPYMNAFEVGSSFWNALSLTTNRYLIWGENGLQHLEGYPFVTLKRKSAA